MSREEERALAALCRAEGLEFVIRTQTRQSHQFKPSSRRAIAGPPGALWEGKEVVFERPSDGALKRYVVGLQLWEGTGRDGNPRKMCDLTYVRRGKPMGTCAHCHEENRHRKMRCSGTGLYCDPMPAVSSGRR